MSQAHILPAVAMSLVLLGAGLAGCNTVRAPRSANANAPAFGADARVAKRGSGSNPNAPFMVADHSARLVQRPALLDVNAAPPCAATDLTLFESGAHIEGDHRSVRLNLVNHAAAACRLSGFPAISLLRPDGRLIGGIRVDKVSATRLEASLLPGATPIVEPTSASAPVLLAPKGEATFQVGWNSSDGGQPCDQVGSIAVAAPGTIESFTVHRAFSVCEGRILVTEVSDGSPL